MTERLSDVETRIGTVHQLAAVITAMRSIAAARSREARGQLMAIRAYAAMIATAISHALAFQSEPRRPPPAPERARGEVATHVIIGLCTEQGFAGVFNERVLDHVRHLKDAEPRAATDLLLVGDRGLMVAEETGLAVDWSGPMIAHTGQVATLANRIVEALYERLDRGRVARVTLVHAIPGASPALEVVEKRLVPFDFGRFPLSRTAVAPLLTLSPNVLLARLVEEYVFAELCEAVMLSYAAENEARMHAMIAARNNVAGRLESLIARSRQLRQEEITNEVTELAAGALANIGSAPKSA
jgi:F-type H+-transporting ATPase subunit gamma